MYYYLLLIAGVLCAHYLIKKKIYKVIMGGLNVIMLMGSIEYDNLPSVIKWIALISGVMFLVGGMFFKRRSLFRSVSYIMYIIMIFVAMRYYGITTGTESFMYLLTNRMVIMYLIIHTFNIACKSMKI